MRSPLAPFPEPAPKPPGPGWLLVCTDSHRQSLTLVVVVGDADIATAPQLRFALLEVVAAAPAVVVVDVEGLAFCDLSGLDALHAGLDAAQAVGVVMTVRGMSTQLARLHTTFPRRQKVVTLPSTTAATPSTRAFSEVSLLGSSG